MGGIVIAHGWPGRDRSEFQIPTTANPDTTLAPRSELKEKDVLNGRLSFFIADIFLTLHWPRASYRLTNASYCSGVSIP
jgi:hypothetical protein